MRRVIVVLAIMCLIAAGIAAWLTFAPPWGGQENDAMQVLFPAEPAEASAAGAGRDGITAQEPVAMPTPSAAELEAALRSEDWHIRLDASSTLPERTDITTTHRTTLLLDMLDREEAQPTDDVAPEAAYLSVSSIIKHQLAQELGSLGPEARPTLLEAMNSRQGDDRAWVILALGYSGASDIGPQIQELLRTSPNAEVRMRAAQVLGMLGRHEAIPDLEQALNDSFSITTEYSGVQSIIYPVREQAFGSLVKLGVKIERSAQGEYKVSGP